MGHGLGTNHKPKRKALKPMGFRAKCWSIGWFELAFLPGDFLSLEPFRTLDHGEFNRLAFFQSAIAICLDRRVVNEHITTRGPLNEAIALSIVEPLYSTSLSTHTLRDSFQMIKIRRTCFYNLKKPRKPSLLTFASGVKLIFDLLKSLKTLQQPREYTRIK
jgi:hypothetical protein